MSRAERTDPMSEHSIPQPSLCTSSGMTTPRFLGTSGGAPKPILRSDVLKMEDLKPGMKLKGTVRNVIDFGAFVDIGVKQDGMVHISEMGNSFVKNPHDVLSVGDIIDVYIKSVDKDRQRIALTMRNPDGAAAVKSPNKPNNGSHSNTKNEPASFDSQLALLKQRFGK